MGQALTCATLLHRLAWRHSRRRSRGPNCLPHIWNQLSTIRHPVLEASHRVVLIYIRLHLLIRDLHSRSISLHDRLTLSLPSLINSIPNLIESNFLNHLLRLLKIARLREAAESINLPDCSGNNYRLNCAEPKNRHRDPPLPVSLLLSVCPRWRNKPIKQLAHLLNASLALTRANGISQLHAVQNERLERFIFARNARKFFNEASYEGLVIFLHAEHATSAHRCASAQAAHHDHLEHHAPRHRRGFSLRCHVLAPSAFPTPSPGDKPKR